MRFFVFFITIFIAITTTNIVKAGDCPASGNLMDEIENNCLTQGCDVPSDWWKHTTTIVLPEWPLCSIFVEYCVR